MKPIARRSTIAERGDIVWVPFPFVEAPRLRERPALVINAHPIEGAQRLLWVLMITSAANRGWPGDVSLESCYVACGLNVPCVVRTAKISTVEWRSARKTGSLPPDVLEQVQAALGDILGLPLSRG